MTISPSANFICRDWGQSSGVNIPFDKERLLAFTPCRHITDTPLGNYYVKCFSIFRGSRHIQYNFLIQPGDYESRRQFGIFSFGRSLLFDVDTGRILDQSPLILCSPNLQLPPEPNFNPSTSYKSFYAGVQTVSFMWWKFCCGDKSEYSFNSTQYEIIERHNGDPQDAMISNVDDNDFDNRTDNSIMPLSMFISIANTQTPFHCDNYLLRAIGSKSCSVEQYAHGLIVVDKHSGLMLKVEPGTISCKKWMTLDGGANGVHVFAVLEDGSRLLGLTRATGKISLREWETSLGTLCREHIYGRS